MFYFQTNALGFTPEFLGRVRLAGSLASLAGVSLRSSCTPCDLHSHSYMTVAGWQRVFEESRSCLSISAVHVFQPVLG